jgi:hypothetical protein
MFLGSKVRPVRGAYTPSWPVTVVALLLHFLPCGGSLFTHPVSILFADFASSDYITNCRPVLSSERAPHRYKTTNFRQQHSDRK